MGDQTKNRYNSRGNLNGVKQNSYLQSSCQNRFNKTKGFTLVELLVVIVILSILMSALVVSVQSSYKSARQTNCKSNLRQFGVALTIYRAEHDNDTPNWLSNLYPEYVDDRAMYVCTADINRGFDRPRPEDLVNLINDKGNSADQPAFWDNRKNTEVLRNRAIDACSYFYEFSSAQVPSSWYNGVQLPPTVPIKTMSDFKHVQLRYGDQANVINGQQMPYSASRIPIARCFHHFRDQKILGYQNVAGGTRSTTVKKDFMTINVAYAGNVFVGPTWWEGTIHPGDSRN